MPEYSTPQTRWAALQSRDPLASNTFVYCVVTTNIYCRPNCPSRLARRANIIFHDTAAEAKADGYRACMRCRPEMNEDERDPQKIAVAKSCNLIKRDAEGGGKRSVKALAKEVGFTESHFCRVFKKITGMTVGDYRSKTYGKQSASSVSSARNESVASLQTPGWPLTPFELDFNADPFHSLDGLTNFEFELDSGSYDFGRSPRPLDCSELDMESTCITTFDSYLFNTEDYAIDNLFNTEDYAIDNLFNTEDYAIDNLFNTKDYATDMTLQEETLLRSLHRLSTERNIPPNR
jgi:methylphosphotriester-DNA--protein-cysteine methyltransferase